MRSLALALLLACGACVGDKEHAQVVACERAGGFWTQRHNPIVNRWVCAQEIIPPVTPEADDAK